MVYHFLRHKDELYEVVKKGLIEKYGLPEDPNGDKSKRDDKSQKKTPKLVLSVLQVT